MLIRRRFVVGMAMLAATWMHARTACACMCDVPLSVTEEFDASAAVFLGEVVAFDPDTIHFAVLESWKGVRSRQVCVHNVTFDCYLPVHVGQQLLVYAYGQAADLSDLVVWECTRTGQYDGALQDVTTLAALGYEPLDLGGPEPGDFNGDGSLDLTDFAVFAGCLTGPCDGAACEPGLFVEPCCAIGDSDDDGDVDLEDVAAFQLAYPGD